MLVHDGIGIWLAARRLNQRQFGWPSGGEPKLYALTHEQLLALFEGRHCQTRLIHRGYVSMFNERLIKLAGRGLVRAGRRAAARSLVQSAKMNGYDPYVYLKNVLARLPVHQAARLDELLPQNWRPEPA